MSIQAGKCVTTLNHISDHVTCIVYQSNCFGQVTYKLARPEVMDKVNEYWIVWVTSKCCAVFNLPYRVLGRRRTGSNGLRMWEAINPTA